MRRVLMMIGLMAASSAQAFMPESGWWWNSARSGEGYNIEIQDGALFLAGFIYNASGAQQWVTAGAPMVSDKQWSAKLYSSTGGSCPSCSYRKPSNTEIGAVSITFSSPTKATLNIMGATIQIARFDYTGISGGNEYLFGEWSMIDGTSIFSAEKLTINGKTTLTDGTPAVTGYRSGNTSRTATGTVKDGIAVLLLDYSTDYWSGYAHYVGAWGYAQEGFNIFYRKGTNPPSVGIASVGMRTKSRAYLATGAGPYIKQAERPDDAKMLRLHADAEVPIAEDVRNVLKALETSMTSR